MLYERQLHRRQDLSGWQLRLPVPAERLQRNLSQLLRQQRLHRWPRLQRQWQLRLPERSEGLQRYLPAVLRQQRLQQRPDLSGRNLRLSLGDAESLFHQLRGRLLRQLGVHGRPDVPIRYLQVSGRSNGLQRHLPRMLQYPRLQRRHDVPVRFLQVYRRPEELRRNVQGVLRRPRLHDRRGEVLQRHVHAGHGRGRLPLMLRRAGARLPRSPAGLCRSRARRPRCTPVRRRPRDCALLPLPCAMRP